MTTGPDSPPAPPADPPTGRSAPSAYVPELDTFRAVAILSVMCVHWLPEKGLVNQIQDRFSSGVQLFFVLSGFLITRILLQSRQSMDDGAATLHHSLRQFYARRALRIFPIYYLALIVGAILHLPNVRTGFWWHATYLSDAYYYRMGSFDRSPALVFWSLSVEEQFYLLWPLLILLVPRRAMIPTVTAVAVLGSIWRAISIWISRDPMIGSILTPTCVNFLALGALVAIAGHSVYGSAKAARWVRWGFAIAIGLLLAGDLAIWIDHGQWHVRAMRIVHQTILSMVYALLFARAVCGFPAWIGPVLRFPPLTYLGRISYGLYVYHLFVAALLLRVAQHFHSDAMAHWSNNPGVLFAATVAVSSASWFLFERPINDLKRFFPYARAK